MNLNNLINKTFEEVNVYLQRANKFIYFMNNKKFCIIQNKNKYYYILDSEKIEQQYKKNIIYLYLQQYENSHYFFQYKYTYYDIEFNSCIRIFKYINNNLIYTYAYIVGYNIIDQNYHFSQTILTKILNFYNNKCFNIFQSYYLLHQMKG